jgi:phage repressor protein C with HTH and peptisase S24 domain
MTWADSAIELLENGESVDVRPRGHSMEPRIKDGALVRLAPNTHPHELEKGDVVLVKVNGRVYLHQVTPTDKKRVQIGNNRGRINGWVPRERPYGKAVSILHGAGS